MQRNPKRSLLQPGVEQEWINGAPAQRFQNAAAYSSWRSAFMHGNMGCPIHRAFVRLPRGECQPVPSVAFRPLQLPSVLKHFVNGVEFIADFLEMLQPEFHRILKFLDSLAIRECWGIASSE